MAITAAIFGSTGLTGKALTEILINDEAFGKVYCYARKPPMFLKPKTEFRPFETDNFSLENDIDVIFCALGTTIKKAGTKEEFREVDLHAVSRIVFNAKETGIKHFAVVSSIGADSKNKNFYLRTKGEMENAVISAGIEHTVIIRPSLLLGERKEKRLAERIGKILLTPFSFLMIGPLRQYRPVKASNVAKKMAELIKISESGLHIIENKAI